jgi:hypothetical protein
VKPTVRRYFNDVISLVVLALMALALIAGQSVATGHEGERASVASLGKTVEAKALIVKHGD